MTEKLFRLVLFTAGVLAVGTCRAQGGTSSDPKLSSVLAKLGAEAARLRDAMPNFECTENGVSTVTRDGKQKKRVTFTAAVTARRDEKGDLDETFRVSVLDGKPYGKVSVRLPFYIQGGFSGALHYFSLQKQPCYNYTLAPGRLSFSAKPDTATGPDCARDTQLDGFATLDDHGNITHMEYRIPVEAAVQYKHLTFDALDLQTVELHGQNYRIISHLTGDFPSGKDLLHFEASYAGCHYFGSSATLLPGSTVVTDDSPTPR